MKKDLQGTAMLRAFRRVSNAAPFKRSDKRAVSCPEVRARLVTLISLANRLERGSLKTGNVEVTNAREVIQARELIAAQDELSKALRKAYSSGLAPREIRTGVVEPVLETSIVGDLAWMVINQALEGARSTPIS